MKRASFRAKLGVMVAGAAALVGILGGIALAAQKPSPPKPAADLAFAEFNGYEAWQYVAPSRVPDGIKIIAANPAMIGAYRAGVPAKGKVFPEGSRAVKIEWSQQDLTDPYAVSVPKTLLSVSFMVKDSKRFPKTHGWAFAQFLYDPATKALKPSGKGPECGYACHTAVAANDYVFTAYPKR